MSLKKAKIATVEEVQRLSFEAALRGMRGERDEAKRRVTVMQGELEGLQKRFDQLAAVRAPFVMTLSTADSMAEASVSNLNECRNIIAVDNIVPIGFAIPLPAISGAEP